MHRLLPYFLSFYGELEHAVTGCKTVVDIGCGTDSPIQAVSDKVKCVGIDIFRPSLEESKKKGIHNKYIHLSAFDLKKKVPDRSFDCAFACEIIEHMTKKQGHELILNMARIAKKRIIIVTPNGYVPQQSYNNNPWQKHKSGWSAEEMSKLGFRVVGLRGWKHLRGEMSYLKYRPKIFFYLLSEFSQLIVRFFPKYAYQILCIKDIS